MGRLSRLGTWLKELDQRVVGTWLRQDDLPARTQRSPVDAKRAKGLRLPWIPEDSAWRQEPRRTLLEIGFPVPIVVGTLFVISGGWTRGAILTRLVLLVGLVALAVATFVVRRRRRVGDAQRADLSGR